MEGVDDRSTLRNPLVTRSRRDRGSFTNCTDGRSCPCVPVLLLFTPETVVSLSEVVPVTRVLGVETPLVPMEGSGQKEIGHFYSKSRVRLGRFQVVDGKGPLGTSNTHLMYCYRAEWPSLLNRSHVTTPSRKRPSQFLSNSSDTPPSFSLLRHGRL